MFHAAFYPLANKDKTKREYSNCTCNKDTAAYTILQKTKGGSLLMSLHGVRALGYIKHEVFTIRRSCLTATGTLLVNTRI